MDGLKSRLENNEEILLMIKYIWGSYPGISTIKTWKMKRDCRSYRSKQEKGREKEIIPSDEGWMFFRMGAVFWVWYNCSNFEGSHVILNRKILKNPYLDTW